MQEELFATLARVGILDDSVRLENVTLNREQNLLTVFFRCGREPSITLTQQLVNELEQRLGTRVRVQWSADCAEETENRAEASFQEPAAKPVV